MAKVDNPRFDKKTGEIKGCKQCPLETNNLLCSTYIRHHNMICPTKDDYAEVARQAEEAHK